MKKGITLALLASSLSASTLKPGQRYSFYQKNGQHLLGAELIAESKTEYTVKLSYLRKPLKIAKQNLLRPPDLVQPANETAAFSWGRELRLSMQLGYSALTTGELRESFRTGYHGAFGIDWHLFTQPRFGIRAVSLLTGFSAFEASPRYIRQLSLYAGPQFILLNWKQAGILLSASPLAGASSTHLRGYTFTAEYLAFSTQVIVRAQRDFGPVSVGLQLFINYLFDQSVSFTSSGLGMSVQYALRKE